MLDILSQVGELPKDLIESRGISVWVLGTILVSSIAAVAGMGKHFLKREERASESAAARELAMLARITAYDEFQRTGMSSLANSLATLNERTISVLQQTTVSQREMTETIRDLASTIQELVKEISVERSRKG